MFPHKIISGGQTGVDRAALDVALELGIPIGGHLPRGRKDENGDVLPNDKYANMQETDADDVNVRTELNVQNSDATLIFSHGMLFGGSEYTERMARQHGKSCLHVDFDKHDAGQAVLLVKTWLSGTQPRVLNVAGPRASDDPAAYSKAKCVLAGALLLTDTGRKSEDDYSRRWSHRNDIASEIIPARGDWCPAVLPVGPGTITAAVQPNVASAGHQDRR
jgi:hypothetical protein